MSLGLYPPVSQTTLGGPTSRLGNVLHLRFQTGRGDKQKNDGPSRPYFARVCPRLLLLFNSQSELQPVAEFLARAGVHGVGGAAVKWVNLSSPVQHVRTPLIKTISR